MAYVIYYCIFWTAVAPVVLTRYVSSYMQIDELCSVVTSCLIVVILQYTGTYQVSLIEMKVQLYLDKGHVIDQVYPEFHRTCADLVYVFFFLSPYGSY